VQFWFRTLTRDPNPVWVRELRQSARLTRTPIILAIVTGMMTLLIASIGGVLSVTAEPAQVGTWIFQIFFSMAFAVVTWVGPAVAATTIASERSGRTWEALLLTGLSPAAIAQGKFLAALTYILLYIVMLAPVGGLAFLFGGVTPIEVLVAFVLLTLIAALSVAFGLAMSSKFGSPAVAILLTLFVAVTFSIMTWLLGGVALSFAVNRLWRTVAGGAPVWLPTAYARADFGLDYAVFLVLYPLVATILPAWLLYEITIANMAAESEDRSTRLRIWAFVSGPVITLGSVLALVALDTQDSYFVGQTLVWLFFTFLAFLAAGDPLGPSPRIEARWSKAPRSVVRRWLGPSVGRAAWGFAFLATMCFGALAATGVASAPTRDERFAALAFGGYTYGFTLFLLGFAVFARARASSPAVPRVLLSGALFLALLGPYIAMAISGILTEGTERTLLVAAPSPAFAFVVVDRLRSPGGDADLFALAGAAASIGWGVLGLALLSRGAFIAGKRWQNARGAPAPIPSSPPPQPAPP
jgi:ABC-type transport system involved in multi-copper enzyme maturation permease subunit